MAEKFKLSEQLKALASGNLTKAEQIFDEIPVSLDEFIKSPKYLGYPTLSPIQYGVVQAIEEVFFQETYPLLAEHEPYWADHKIHVANYIPVMIGKGGGKDFICGIGLMRVNYLLLCLRSPQSYFNLGPDSSIHSLNMASSSRQALTAFFTPVKRAVRKGWFADKCDIIRNEIRFNKGLEAISGHSDAETQEGMSLILGLVDEIDAMPSEGESRSSGKLPVNSAEGIVRMIEGSGSTRFPKTFKNVFISYPRYKGSPIMTLLDKGKKDNLKKGLDSRWLVVGPHTTWEANPTKSKADFQDKYDEDPIAADAIYGCKPHSAVAPYFRNRELIEGAMVHYAVNPLEISGYKKSGESWEPEYEYAPDFVPVQGASYVIHADMALKHDRAGVAMSHVVKYEEYTKTAFDNEGLPQPVIEERPVVKTDFVIYYEADPGTSPAREIQMRWFRQLVSDLRTKGFNIVFASQDGFGSLDGLQIMAEWGIETKKVSTDTHGDEIYGSLRDMLSDGRVVVQHDEILKTELLSLTRNTKGKIDHQTQGSKDVADAWACSVSGAIVWGGAEATDEQGQPMQAFYGEAEFFVGAEMKMPLAFGEGFSYQFEHTNFF